MKPVVSPIDIPDGSHFQLCVFEQHTFHIPGDERSRTHPGHGYPAHDETVKTVTMYVTTEESELKETLKQLYNSDPKRKDIVVTYVHKKITFSVGIEVWF